jgi:DNA polymerase III epsilon subunit-like protein
MLESEFMVSVDVEASGQSPAVGSLLAIGACLVEDFQVGLYLELKPLPGLPWDAAAERVHHLDRGQLAEQGLEPPLAMTRFDEWLVSVGKGRRPVFVGFNAPFDWMFVADYFHRFIGRNPFGISALDIKSYYMGREGVTAWAETARRFVERRYPVTLPHSHHALEDARGQAELMRLLFARSY